MYYWERYGDVQLERPQPFAKDKVYVVQGIVDYAKAAGIPLRDYCRRIEREVPSNPGIQFIPYNGSNHEHVNDVINEGCLLIGNSSIRGEMALQLHSKEEGPTYTQAERESASTFVKAATTDPAKESTIRALQNAGISYNKRLSLKDEDSHLFEVRFID